MHLLAELVSRVGFRESNTAKAEKQFKTMQELSELNWQKKLGLRIVPTIRLRRTIFGRKR